MAKPYRIAVDFDGTCVKHKYPATGDSVPDAAYWLWKLSGLGAQIFLWTMRSAKSKHGDRLTVAEQWFAQHDIPLAGTNHDDEQESWTSSPKLYAHAYVDDAAACAPLIQPIGGRPFLDWSIVGPWLEQQVITWNEAHNAHPVCEHCAGLHASADCPLKESGDSGYVDTTLQPNRS